MYDREDDTANISFQWVVGDTRAQEKNIRDLISPSHTYLITVISRLAAFALTYVVADALLPNADFFVLIWIVLAASLSIWVSVAIELLSARALEHLRAEESHRVGWNSVWLDAHGIVWSTEISEFYTSWLGVEDVVERDGTLWIKTGEGIGYYLPPQAFSSNEELLDCMELIQNLRKNPRPPSHIVNHSEEMVRH